jgi:hypothetical protein
MVWAELNANANFNPSFANSWRGYGAINVGAGSVFQTRPDISACDPGMAQSFSASGILIGLLDGHVRNVAPSITGSTWWAACTPDAGDLLGNDW